ncbi:hypothetical protein [Glutamicibacter arilaitensis]|uniref:hypothetical protein n=1 Tax=Glutamicibacter arilaitensis TaxID=256701 RepID=UPI003FD5D270
MTIYFAPPGEPLDGDNWQELGYLSEDGLQIEGDERTETIEITPEIRTNFSASFTFELEDSREFVNAMFGYDVYALRATVAEWLTRPAPMPSIPKAELAEMQDGINALLTDFQQAVYRYALKGGYPNARLRHSR